MTASATKKIDQVADRPEARKELERTNPEFVAARDRAYVEVQREKIEREQSEKLERRQKQSQVARR
jgi:hypothetical protein